MSRDDNILNPTNDVALKILFKRQISIHAFRLLGQPFWIVEHTFSTTPNVKGAKKKTNVDDNNINKEAFKREQERKGRKTELHSQPCSCLLFCAASSSIPFIQPAANFVHTIRYALKYLETSFKIYLNF